MPSITTLLGPKVFKKQIGNRAVINAVVNQGDINAYFTELQNAGWNPKWLVPGYVFRIIATDTNGQTLKTTVTKMIQPQGYRVLSINWLSPLIPGISPTGGAGGNGGTGGTGGNGGTGNGGTGGGVTPPPLPPPLKQGDTDTGFGGRVPLEPGQGGNLPGGIVITGGSSGGATTTTSLGSTPPTTQTLKAPSQNHITTLSGFKIVNGSGGCSGGRCNLKI